MCGNTNFSSGGKREILQVVGHTGYGRQKLFENNNKLLLVDVISCLETACRSRVEQVRPDALQPLH